MENKTKILIVIGIIVFLILIYLFLRKIGVVKREGETSTGTGTSSSTSTVVNTATNTITNTNTGTGTATTPPTSNQLTLSKTIPVYYLQLPGTGQNQILVHQPSQGVVANVTLPKDSDTGNTITISKVWNFGSQTNPNIYYETTQKVKYLTNPSSYGLGDYYLVKKSDL